MASQIDFGFITIQQLSIFTQSIHESTMVFNTSSSIGLQSIKPTLEKCTGRGGELPGFNATDNKNEKN